MKTQRVTLKDIGERVGVSPVAVSAALGMLSSNSPVRLSEETAEQVRRIAGELGYQRNNIARAFRSKRTQTIGLLFRVVSNTQPVNYLIDCMHRELQRHEYHAYLSPFHSRYELFERGVRDLVGWQVDGLILSHVYGSDDADGQWSDLEQWLTKLNIPVVLVESTLPAARTHPRLAVDMVGASALAARHLIDLGHRRLAFVSDPRGASRERWEAVQRVAGEQGGVQAEWIILDTTTASVPTLGPLEAAQRAGAQLAQRDMRPTGLICGNDSVARGLVGAMQGAGLDIPGDVSVIGYDNSEAAVMCEPRLTTFQQPVELLAQQAVEALLGRVAGDRKGAESSQFAAELIIRDSTASFGPED